MMGKFSDSDMEKFEHVCDLVYSIDPDYFVSNKAHVVKALIELHERAEVAAEKVAEQSRDDRLKYGFITRNKYVFGEGRATLPELIEFIAEGDRLAFGHGQVFVVSEEAHWNFDIALLLKMVNMLGTYVKQAGQWDEFASGEWVEGQGQ